MSAFERLSSFVVKRLGEEQLRRTRHLYLRARSSLAPVMRVLHGTFDSAALKAHLTERIGTDFEVLMVHSSVNNMAPMYTDGPLQFVKMLMEFCADGKTLVMPAFYFGEPGSAGARSTFRANPVFDLRKTPSQMGLATELFRRTKGVVCSRHPIYRCAAFGPLAADLVAGHEHAETACGVGSPFDFMAGRETVIIGVGKPIEVLTQVHHAEAIMGSDFPVPQKRGEPLEITLVEKDARTPIVLRGSGIQWPRDMWKLRQIMSPTDLQEWSFHGVPMFATRAARVTECIIDAAKKGLTIYNEPSQ